MIVRIDRITVADKAILLKWRNSVEVSEWMYTNHVISDAEHSAWFDRMLRNEATVYWKIVMNGLPVGAVVLSELNASEGSCSWAIYLGDPSARGLGVAQAACLLSLNVAFDELGIDVVRCEAIAQNMRAIGLYEQIGFVSKADDSSRVRRGNDDLAIVKLELSQSSWRSRKESVQQILLKKGVSVNEE